MNKSQGVTGASLSLVGMRIAPRDPSSHAAKVGHKQEVVKPDYTTNSFKQRVLKEKSGFSGGFKIPEEQRKKKMSRKGYKDLGDEEDDLEGTQQSQITKDEIFQHLNLGNSESGIGVGRHGTHSKAALAKDLVEGIEKDLEKLKRQQDNISLRRTLASKGASSIVEQTDEEKKFEEEMRMKRVLEEDGAHVIAASPKKIQTMRHQASQLYSHANMSLEELEQMRRENEERLKYLEDVYMRKKENSGVGTVIREKMGLKQDYSMRGKSPKSSQQRRDQDFDENDERDEMEVYDNQKQTFKSLKGGNKSLERSDKKKKSVRIVENADEVFERRDTNNRDIVTAKFGDRDKSRSLSKPRGGYGSAHGGVERDVFYQGEKSEKRKGRSKSREKEEIVYESPRRKLYEAKFEKYIANKENKKKVEKKLQSMQKEDFERYMQGTQSPSKQTNRYKNKMEASNKGGALYDPESLISKNYDTDILRTQSDEENNRTLQKTREDDFREMGVTSEDKMTYFLLKWMFNAIKRDSAAEDPKLKGNPYVTKQDLVKQLSKNDELMKVLGYNDSKEIGAHVKGVPSVKEGCLQWEEFLDLFFLRKYSNMLQRGIAQESSEYWWRKIGKPKQEKETEKVDTQASQQSPSKDKKGSVPRYNTKTSKQQVQVGYKYDDPDKKPVKMTDNLKHLQDLRSKRVEEEVEEEFQQMQEKRALEQKSNKLMPGSPSRKGKKQDVGQQEGDSIEEMFGIKREKSQCLLLKSQIQVMRDIYESMDKYKDQILRRGEYVMNLRTDERVVDFIDVEAVKLAYSKKTLTLDEIFSEIEKDELYELTQMGKGSNQINHKEFITWKEFINYFYDYKEIEERNQVSKHIQQTRKSMQQSQQVRRTEESANELDNSAEIGTLMEQEKQRRLKDLPKIRPADQIDISEKQLQLLKDLYDSLPKVQVGKDMINAIDFFIAVRKSPQIRTLNTTIARDPEGTSRIPRETFQQVFDRMESELAGQKQIEWAQIIEYFTKRGRPLTKEEIQKLQDQDRKQREEEEAKKRAEEEAERRRMARLMEDLEDKEDFDEYEKRQQSDNLTLQFNGKKQFSTLQNERGEDQEGEDDEDQDRDDYDEEVDEDEYGDELEREDYRDEDRDMMGDGDGYASDPELMTANRNYKFGREGSRRRNKSAKAKMRKGERSRSAKSFNEKNLRNVKLTTADYMDNEKDKNRKKGKYGVTVPQPFNFDMRDKVKPKTIREKKVDEMVAEKRIEEENIIKHQFRHNPIPPQVLVPRYQAIMEAKERRRLTVKQNSIALTKQNEKPFSFYVRDKYKQKADPEEYLCADLKKPQFKANPIPRACSVLIFDQMMKKAQQEREERVRKNAELNYSKAKLPERMQMHEEKKKQMPTQKSEVEFYSFKPKINDLVTKEQFVKKQEGFMKQLSKKKAQKQQTQPRSPNFTKKQSKGLEREYLNENYQQSMRDTSQDKIKAALAKSLAKAMQDKGTANPSSTKATNLAMQRRREELEEDRKKKEAQKKADEQRFQKQNRMKTVVQAALQGRIKDETEKRQEEIELRKKQAAKEEKQNREAIRAAVDKARSGPLLIEQTYNKVGGSNYSKSMKGSGATNLDKIKSTMQFSEVLKNNKIDPKRYMDDEQREILEDQEFIEKKKKEYGRL